MILSPAKLNISLNVNGLLDNSYHSISSYVFFLDLFDKLYIEKSSFNRVIVSGLFKDDLINNGGDTIINKSISFCQNYYKRYLFLRVCHLLKWKQPQMKKL